MSDIMLIRRQLNAVITNVKKESKKAEELQNAEEKDNFEISASIAALQSYQGRISEYSEAVLQSITDDTTLDAEIDRFEEAKIQVIKTIAKLEATLEVSHSQNGEARQTSEFGGEEEGVRWAVGGGLSVNLPKLEIKKFAGDPMKFQEFWDTFDTTINQKPNLAPVEKFKYLRSYLQGDALLLTEGYSLTAANYEAVLDVLKERFGDPELAIFCHLDALLAVQTAGNQSKELQRVYDECECHIRSLVGLGMPEATFGRVFVPILLSKMPSPVRVSLHQKKGTGVGWTLAELREMIRTEIYAREMGKRSFNVQTPQAEPRPKPVGQGYGYNNGNFRRNGVASASALTIPSNGNNVVCHFCKGSHYSDQCRKFPDINSRKAAINDACFNCLKSGHTAAQCRTKRSCFFCKRDTHHRSLCPSKFGWKRSGNIPSADTKVATGSTQEQIDRTANATIVTRGKRGVLQTAIADVVGRRCKSRARLLLDIGSDNTYATNKFLKQIEAEKKGTDVVGLAGFQNKKRTVTSSPVHEMSLMLKNGDEMKLQVYGTDTITCPIEKQSFDSQANPILERVTLAEPLTDEVESVEIDILIGSDYYYDIVRSERISLSGGLYLLDSKLGYIIAGRIESDNMSTLTSMVASLGKRPLPATNFDLERFWKLEEIGIREELETSEDEKAMAFFNKTVEFDEDEKRYQVKWPWKEENPELPDNFNLCYGRLKSLTNRLQQNKSVLEKYQKTIDDQLAKKMIEEVPSEETGNLVHYIPHHGVSTPNKATTKLRVVYDASSKANKYLPSLNECLYRGPVMLNDLCGLLIRFRLPRIAIVSDLEKAFLQIGLKEQDRDVTRFLWLRNPNEPFGLDNLVHYRFRRVCFGLISSPFLLSATVAHHLNKLETSTAKDISRNIYVDNIIGGVNNTAEGIEYYKEAKEIFRNASMNLREFFTNNAVLRSEFQDADVGVGPSTKVLGLAWNTSSDTLKVSVGQDSASSHNKLTKRIVLRSIAQIFDPLGLFSPITTMGKLLMQELWKEKYDWDEILPSVIVKKYQTFFTSYIQIPDLEITRHIGLATSLTASRVVLHCFSDASTKAFCAVVYLQLISDEDNKVNILMSKSRICPLKNQSIPRLELLSILIGTRLLTFVEKQLMMPVTRRILWSDSQCALYWVLKKTVNTKFVKNQVQKIRETSNVEFRYVPTKENPADIPTRGCKFEELSSCELWWHGPEWLNTPESWPEVKIQMDCGTKEEETTVTIVTTPCAVSIFDASRFSTLHRLVRVVVYVKRFIRRLRKEKVNTSSVPSINEVEEARAALICEAQNRHFSDLFKVKSKANTDLIQRFKLFKSRNGIIRCQGRIIHSELPWEANCPILLPKNDGFSFLVVKEQHEKLHHAGVKHTLSELRYQYWLVGGRNEIKRAISRCVVCKWLRGKSFRVPDPPPLPEFRVKGLRPFSAVGLDYLGPIYIFSGKSETEKTWICLFTCSVTRAIHLEVVTNMSAAEFLLAFRRFIATCGCPDIVISDNAKTFVAAEKAIRQLWKDLLTEESVKQFSVANNIKWKFIVELSPWMGGFYERLVGVVKHGLKSALHLKKVDLIELQTTVSEVSTVVNSRPLVYSEDEVGDFALTPAHLIMRHHSVTPFPESSKEEDEYMEKLTTTKKLQLGWKRLQAIIGQFWKIWRRNYITSLREQSQARRQRSPAKEEPRINMPVLIERKNCPRGVWEVGRVLELKTSSDGKVRSALVKAIGGRILHRPIKLLYPLEVSAAVEINCTKNANFHTESGINDSELAQTSSPGSNFSSCAADSRKTLNTGSLLRNDNGVDNHNVTQTFPCFSNHNNVQVHKRQAAINARQSIKNIYANEL